MNNQDHDQNSRDKIRNDISHNFFVEAGAGSGKTTVLVDRMVKMVESGIDISKICAITFTKAAASEFYARFQSKLSESKNPVAKDALKNIDLCFMGTIDAFCNMVLSEHPAEAKIPSDASIVSEDELVQLCRREFSRIRSGVYETEDPELNDQCKTFVSYFYNAEEIFLKIVPKLMDTRNAKLNIAKEAPDLREEKYKEKIENIKSILIHLANVEEASYEKGKNKDCDNALKALKDGIRNIDSDWEDNLSNVLFVLGKIKKIRVSADYDIDKFGLGFNDVFEPHTDSKSDKAKWYEIPSDGDPLLINELNNVRFSLATDFLSKSAKLISETLRKEGKLSYTDYLFYLREMLKQDAESGGKLIDHFYSRYSYFLIDEFQDTNPLQAEVFFYLCAKDPKPNWKECVPKPGSLFIVGDPKQSIYRFRNADVTSYKKVKALFTGEVGEVLLLSRNFRSTDKLCGWFNDVFTRLLPKDTEDQSKYEPIPLGDKDEYKGSLNGTFKYSVVNKRSYKDSDDPGIVSEIILGLVNDPDVTIQVREGDKTVVRRPEFKDFMIITPSKTHMSYYMNSFSENEIPFKIEGKLLFNECPALIMIYRIMSAVADVYDRKSRFVLSSLSGCDISKDELDEYVQKSKNLSPAALFALILDKDKIFAKAGTENAEYVYFALELLRKAEADGTVSSIQDGVEFIESLFTKGPEQERCIQLQRDSNRVHMANLHKVKGLEAPIVILADPNQSQHIPDFRVDYSGDDPERFIFKIDPSCGTTKYADEMAAEQRTLDAEQQRLLYVAVTRAEVALIAGISTLKNGSLNENNPWGVLDGYISDDINKISKPYIRQSKEDKTVDAEKLYDQGEKDTVIRNDAPLEKSYEIKRPSTIKVKGASEPDADIEEAAESRKRSSIKDPALAGTMVHRVMEVLVSSQNRTDKDELVEETLKEYANGDTYYRDILGSVIDTVRNGGYEQETSVAQDILKELLSADKVFCELPFCYTEDKEHIWHGIMDVVYCKEGKWHIVDYKTNADPEDLDEKYVEQLDAYKAAFKEMTGETADAMIYHIDLVS